MSQVTFRNSEMGFAVKSWPFDL